MLKCWGPYVYSKVETQEVSFDQVCNIHARRPRLLLLQYYVTISNLIYIHTLTFLDPRYVDHH